MFFMFRQKLHQVNLKQEFEEIPAIKETNSIQFSDLDNESLQIF